MTNRHSDRSANAVAIDQEQLLSRVRSSLAAGNSPTVTDLIDAAITLDPVRAIRIRRDEESALLFIDRIVDETGTTVDLQPCLNRFSKSGYVFIYARVSTQKQRDREAVGEGWSMRTQFERAIRYCVANRWQMCIFSDATLSGGMPTNDDSLIETLWQTKANVYRNVMRAIWLPSYMEDRTDAARRAIETYIEEKYRLILRGKVKVAEELDENTDEKRLDRQLVSINKQGQEVTNKVYRPGLNCLLKYLPDASKLVVTDSSRIARSQYLMQHMLLKIKSAEVETVGLIESWDWPNRDDVGSVITGGVLSALHEDIIKSACANTLRGVRTRLERGEQHGLLPFWYVRTPKGKPCKFCGCSEWEKLKSEHHLCRVRVEHAQRIVRLYLDEGDDTERGYQKVGAELERANIPPKKVDHWHWTAVRRILNNPALIGKEREFGLLWDTLDRIISDDDWLRVQHKAGERKEWFITNRAQKEAPGRYLLTGLMTCMECGKGLVYAKASDRYQCNRFNTGRVGKVFHARISGAQVDTFFDSMFAACGEYALSFVIDDDRAIFERRSVDVKAELLQLTKDIPVLEEQARKDAEAELEQNPKFARAMGSPAFQDMVAAAVRMEMDERYQRRETLRERLRILAQDYADANPLSRRSDVEQALLQWSKLRIEQKNAFLRTYFHAIRVEWDSEGEWLRPVLRDEVQEWPRIPITLEKTRYGFSRTLPDPKNYVLQAIRSHVPANLDS